ncbi:hypothetical protein NIES2135_24770 [Leptolyngbya boryana NIES-2135]|jgi:rRNA-processing protein FCF1|uniref:PIN domain-containing protein n=2 Tax=Leptolyngbya boryana TaxID=1184 RepID=A0A1Z4JG72_LEPBY|nr:MULTISPECIES: hypothetical protein [Leptolyngbya]BAY55653.1 hypothetical protein NIES2135_24770 [Leptolyngbya boryana NIES-2135]MBD2370012.1 hypothetical protein [Leptolyngbya sp. FACHB-161]MBD2376286.1 hypothetical protein [Leptolyngbya sp. FACHB-238]MBD2400561.1 hypothetical protein [Leptolyngbya sp. FACHB-239]MBD2407103.1 hypothetical protein [Leptolyngbya sp. FACHB-402]
MLDAPEIFLLIDLNTLFACKPYEWLEFSPMGRCFVPEAVHQELEAWAGHRSDTAESKIAREYCRLMLEGDWYLARSPIPADTQRPFTRRARLAIDVRNSAESLAQSSPRQLVVVVSNDRALLQQLHALRLDNLTGVPVSTFLTWSRTKRQPPVVIQHVRSMQSHSLQLLSAGNHRHLRPFLTSNYPKFSSQPVYHSTWRDRVLPLLPLILILSGLTLGWCFAQPFIQQLPSTSEQNQ